MARAPTQPIRIAATLYEWSKAYAERGNPEGLSSAPKVVEEAIRAFRRGREPGASVPDDDRAPIQPTGVGRYP